MSEILIVGGGLAGLSLSKALSAKGVEYQGLEREGHLGGRLAGGHLRFYAPEAKDAFADLFPQAQWETIEEAPIQIKKGAFEAVSETLSVPEQYYLGHTFSQPTTPRAELIGSLPTEITDHFHLRSPVTRVDLTTRSVICLNGTEIPFKKLIWTSSLASLLKAVGQTPKGLTPKKGAVTETGGIVWDVVVKEPLFAYNNTVVFPFRYKDDRLRALGVRAPAVEGGLPAYHWMMFLDDSWLENREELAKIVRTFKRELGKQFPTLETQTVRERFEFHRSIAGESPVSVASLEVFENVACVGSDIQTEELSSVAESHLVLQNEDRVLRNCLDLVETLLPTWTGPVPTEKASVESEVVASL